MGIDEDDFIERYEAMYIEYTASSESAAMRFRDCMTAIDPNWRDTLEWTFQQGTLYHEAEHADLWMKPPFLVHVLYLDCGKNPEERARLYDLLARWRKAR